jgi:hypothetical protein
MMHKKQDMDSKMLEKTPYLFYSKIFAMTAGAFLLGKMMNKR